MKESNDMEPIKLIFDTDVGADCDDMYALAYLAYAERSLGLQIKAITHSNGCDEGLAVIRSFFSFLGEPIPPLGRAHGIESHDGYCRAVAERFASSEDYADAPDAVSVLRRALVECDRAVICGVGPLMNLAALLESGPDEISGLDGVSLVRERCERVVVMAGRFDIPEPEWNAKVDAEATRTLVRLCPVPIVFSPFELGSDMITGGPLMDKYEEENPVSMSFCRYGRVKEKGGRHSWDPATVLYAVEGCGELFEESARGRVKVDADGTTTFCEGDGLHSVISVKCPEGVSEAAAKARVAARLDECALRLFEGL